MPPKSDYVIPKPVSHPPIKLSPDEMEKWNEDYHGPHDHQQALPTDLKEAAENLMKAMNKNPETEFDAHENEHF